MFEDEEDDDEAPSYEVGYRRPPREHQFKPGNKAAAGKRGPRHAQGLRTMLNKIMKEKVSVVVDGRRVRMTRKEAMLRSFIHDSRRSNRDTMRLLELIIDSPEEKMADVTAKKITVEFVHDRPKGLPGGEAVEAPAAHIDKAKKHLR